MRVQWYNQEVFHGEMLRKLFGIVKPQCYEKGDPIVFFSVYKTDKTPYQMQVDENGKKRREFFWVY